MDTELECVETQDTLAEKTDVKKGILRLLRCFITGVFAVASLLFSFPLLLTLLGGTGFALEDTSSGAASPVIMDRYDTYISNCLSDALEGVKVIRKHYWLSDEDMIAPEPDQSCFGETDDPASLQWLLDRADRLLDVGDTLFSVDTVIKPGSVVRYYLDETIFMVAWQEVINNGVYTMSEVKIADASQFRRFMADGTYGSDKQYLTTEMATTVNAVVASSGDFYKFRNLGVIVVNGQVMRANNYIDVCYIDDKGDMLFTRMGEMNSVEEAQAFVDEHNIRFTLAFGPVLVDNYQLALPSNYFLGEPYGNYSRAALAQMGERHYLLVAANFDGYSYVPTITRLAERMMDFGVQKAYALDGGQTATIVVNDMLFNKPDYGSQRRISDIIYFATAIPNEE